jgi:OMF family outer membrane factor
MPDTVEASDADQEDNPPDPLEAQKLPLAIDTKGERPQSDPSVLPPAADQLPPGNTDLTAPASLALPDKPSQVRIRRLRPMSLGEVETIAEVNNPNLKAIALQVEQAQSALRAQIALWYPNINLNATSFPAYTAGQNVSITQQPQQDGTTNLQTRNTTDSITSMDVALQITWGLINPTRTPRIAAARDAYEQAKNQYLISLRELRLNSNLAYFSLQSADEQVRIGQESVRASLISLRDARARFRAGVATKLEVLEAETQLARDQQLLSSGLADQATARRSLASLLDLPQDVTPTAKDPSRVIGTWMPSLQESIIAAYAFREELDQIILDISIANSNANTELGAVQPFLNIFNTFGVGRAYGYRGLEDARDANGTFWNVDNSVGLNLSWNLFDGGAARANYRRQKQIAEESRFRFAEQRDSIRQEVEQNFFTLELNNRNIATTSREVISTRESLRLARLRFQAGVTTQREVVDTQRDLTQAEVRYANAITDYNSSLAQLRRLTGLDQITLCPAPSLPATRPVVEGASDIPVEPQPVIPACTTTSSLPGGAIPDS